MSRFNCFLLYTLIFCVFGNSMKFNWNFFLISEPKLNIILKRGHVCFCERCDRWICESCDCSSLTKWVLRIDLCPSPSPLSLPFLLLIHVPIVASFFVNPFLLRRLRAALNNFEFYILIHEFLLPFQVCLPIFHGIFREMEKWLPIAVWWLFKLFFSATTNSALFLER